MHEDIKDGTDAHPVVAEVVFNEPNTDEPTPSCAGLTTGTTTKKHVTQKKIKNNTSKSDKKGGRKNRGGGY